MVVCSQPRKLAATFLADRVAYEFSGGQVNYKKGKDGAVGVHVGGAKDVGKYTRIKFVTEGVLLNEMLHARQRHLAATSGASSDGPIGAAAKYNSKYAAVVLDEVHERSIVTDLLLGLFKEWLSSTDPSHRASAPLLVVTSATLDVQKFQDFFGAATLTGQVPHLNIPGRMYPVIEHHLPIPDSASPIAAAAEKAFAIHADVASDPGDILIFVPGQEECMTGSRAVQSLLNRKSSVLKRKATVLQLYSKQLPEEQAMVRATPPDGARKIIFTTNIAETSVTIDGVTHVVDTGLAKEAIFDQQRGMTILREHVISKSSAIQRRGRAGRTQPGSCYRLYSEDDFAEMRQGQVPEILRSPLALEILRLRLRGVDPRNFLWMDPPDPDDVTTAERELELLGCVDAATGEVTRTGQVAVELEIDPKLARLVSLGLERSIVRSALAVAAILSSGSDVWFRPPAAATAAVKEAAVAARAALTAELGCHGDGDVILATRVLFKWETLGDDNDNRSSAATSTVSADDDRDDGDLSDLSGDEMGTNLHLRLHSPFLSHSASWEICLDYFVRATLHACISSLSCRCNASTCV
jgi:HrpA-like RNA helicase